MVREGNVRSPTSLTARGGGAIREDISCGSKEKKVAWILQFGHVSFSPLAPGKFLRGGVSVNCLHNVQMPGT